MVSEIFSQLGRESRVLVRGSSVPEIWDRYAPRTGKKRFRYRLQFLN